MDGYFRLQQRMLLATLALTALALPISAWLYGSSATVSLLVGAIAGLLYLRLLARSVARLGAESNSIGKAQLLVPLILLFAAAKLPQLDILPSLVGFLLYKPALIFQALLNH